jgi:hypothetical protein
MKHNENFKSVADNVFEQIAEATRPVVKPKTLKEIHPVFENICADVFRTLARLTKPVVLLDLELSTPIKTLYGDHDEPYLFQDIEFVNRNKQYPISDVKCTIYTGLDFDSPYIIDIQCFDENQDGITGFDKKEVEKAISIALINKI